VADVVLNETVRAADYSAIVFTGYTVDPYLPYGSHGAEIRRLLSEARQSGRLLTAVCRGQVVLLLHGELRGKRAARSQYALDQYRPNGAIDCDSHVERAGQCITAAADSDAFEFAAAIAAAMDERR
jgi:putative intracellular protease/amidase